MIIWRRIGWAEYVACIGVTYGTKFRSENVKERVYLEDLGVDWRIILSGDWLQTGCGLVIGFIEHLQIVTTRNYSAIANSHTLQFTTARTKPSQSAMSPLLPCSCSCRLATVPQLLQNQSPSYFMTGGLPPISSSWRQAPWPASPWRPDSFFNWPLAVIALM
jgi:hypothetical protein